MGLQHSRIRFYRRCTMQRVNGSKHSRLYAYNSVTYGNCIQVCSKMEKLGQKIYSRDEIFQLQNNPAEFSTSFFVVHGFVATKDDTTVYAISLRLSRSTDDRCFQDNS